MAQAQTQEYDVIIIGSGAGGGTLTHALAAAGKKVLLIERGGYLPRENENWLAEDVFVKNRYTTTENWYDKEGNPFVPGEHYFVGGKTKMFGAALLRLREKDFGEVRHYGGVSPAWPLGYEEFQPYYLQAEKLYSVHGERGEDPLEPPEKKPYFFPSVSHEPFIQDIFDKLKSEKYKPFHLPLGIRLNEKDPQNSQCVRCKTCDGFPCLVEAKSDAHTTCVKPALKTGNVTLLINTKALRLIPDKTGSTIKEVEVERDGEIEKYRAKIFVSSCGAVNSAALFLRSRHAKHPNGLANESDCVGRYYMCHNNSAIVAVSEKENRTKYPKTIGLNDFYYGAPDSEFPLGHIQLLGKVEKEMLGADAPKFTPGVALEYLTDHCVGWWITSEDLPDPKNRVTLNDRGDIVLSYTPNNLEAHERLLKKLKMVVTSTGPVRHIFPNTVYFSKQIPIAGVAHQVGTLRFGDDPKTSVLDTNCKAHSIDNLYAVDASFFPSIGAVNPALTIMANALRVADVILKRV